MAHLPITAEIRFATAADAVPIAEMSRDLIERGLGWSWTPERVRRSLVHPDTNVIVAVRDGARVGFGIMKYAEREAHLLLLAVRPGHARLGIGGVLLAWLERSAQVAGIGRVQLEARMGNETAQAFYARHGYVPREVLPGYYRGREASVRMEKRLVAR